MINVEKLAKINESLLGDLRERGHSDLEISEMTPEQAFDEWCGWELGDPYWGVEIRSIMSALRDAIVEEPKSDLVDDRDWEAIDRGWRND